jgi:Ferrous iron transport protein B C terminus
MVALYFGGILMGILMALLLRGTMFKGEAVPFVMELPNYRMPGAKNVGQLLWEKAKDFLSESIYRNLLCNNYHLVPADI